MDNFDNILHEGQPHNISRRSFMLRASVLATSAALLTFSPVGRAIAGWATGPGEMPEAVGRLLQDNCLAFNGERRDPVTGLYHLGQGYRAYNPRMMRFHAADSLSPFGEGGVNPYAYCLGDPINAIDPTGHLSWQAGLGIALGILGIIISIASLGIGIHAGIALNFTGVALVASSVLGVASGAFGIASAALEERNPELSAVMGWVSLVTGMASGVAGIAGAVATISKASTIIAASATGGAATALGSPTKATIVAAMQGMRSAMGVVAAISSVTSAALWAANTTRKGKAIDELNQAAAYFALIGAISGALSLNVKSINRFMTRALRSAPRLDAANASLGGSRSSLSNHATLGSSRASLSNHSSLGGSRSSFYTPSSSPMASRASLAL